MHRSTIYNQTESTIDFSKLIPVFQRYAQIDAVYLFGSVARSSSFTHWSDIDLAVSGIASNKFYFAVAAISGLSPDFTIDLVDCDDCEASLRSHIYLDGTEL